MKSCCHNHFGYALSLTSQNPAKYLDQEISFCYMGPGTAIRGRKEDRRGRSTFVVHDTSVVVLLEDHWRPMVVP